MSIGLFLDAIGLPFPLGQSSCVEGKKKNIGRYEVRTNTSAAPMDEKNPGKGR